jgi:hypothetical protein
MTPSTVGDTMRAAASVLLALLALPLASNAAAGQKAADPATAIVRGYVVDRATGQPVHGASVEFADLERRLITDQQGRFAVLNLPWGSHTVRVSMLGYEDYESTWQVAREQVSFTIALGPRPIVLEGVTAHGFRFAEQLNRRRQRTGVSTRVIERERLSITDGGSAHEAVLSLAGLFMVGCPGVQAARVRDEIDPEESRSIGHSPHDQGDLNPFDSCLNIRGRTMRPRVFIDDRPAPGGLRDLDVYRPDDLFMVEVYQGGSQIRAYTTWWVEIQGRHNRSPMALIR